MIMKKYFLMVVMLFTMGINSFANDKNVFNLDNTERYEIKVNYGKLSKWLNLSQDQEGDVEMFIDELSSDFMFIANECDNSNRVVVTKNALRKNIKNMFSVLDKEQYHKYLAVLNATLNNRNIEH